MKNYLYMICFFLGFSGFSQEIKLSPTEISTFKQKVEKETQELKSIRTDFIQSKHMAFLSNDIESKGKMFLINNGNLKWEYSSPNEYSVIFKNNVIMINDGGKKKTVSGEQDIFKKINHLIAGSISGKLFDDKEFDIHYFKNGEEIIAKLKPNNNNLKKYIQEVNLFFKQNEATVAKVKLIEPSGDYTFITFVNKELNVKIDSNIFNQ